MLPPENSQIKSGKLANVSFCSKKNPETGENADGKCRLQQR
jgi:hypothetical protein